MSDEATYRPTNQEKDSLYNRQPGIVVIPGSNYANEMQKFEQFPSKYGGSPGNPYVKREFPKMLYRAEEYKGKVCCMAAPPDSHDFGDPREYERADEGARRFTEKCQKIVGNETEMSRAKEDGWREGPEEAVSYLLSRQREQGTQAAHRNHDDRNMSAPAKREAKKIAEEIGDHVPEIPEQPKRRGRPVGSKNKPKV